MSNIDKNSLAKTRELATLMVERISMNPVSCKLLNEAWKKEFPGEVAIADRMLALLDELEAKDKQIADLKETFRIALSAAGIDAPPQPVKESDMADKLNIRAEDVEPGDVVITSHGKCYTVKSFWMEDDTVTLFGTDGSETEYDYDEMLDVERD